MNQRGDLYTEGRKEEKGGTPKKNGKKKVK